MADCALSFGTEKNSDRQTDRQENCSCPDLNCRRGK